VQLCSNYFAGFIGEEIYHQNQMTPYFFDKQDIVANEDAYGVSILEIFYDNSYP